MPNDAYEYMKMLLNVNKNAKLVIECELHGNVRFLALMNASSRYWSSIQTNECVFSRNEQQKLYIDNKKSRTSKIGREGISTSMWSAREKCYRSTGQFNLPMDSFFTQHFSEE